MKINKEFAPITIVLEDKHDLFMLKNLLTKGLDYDRVKNSRQSFVESCEQSTWAKKLLDL